MRNKLLIFGLLCMLTGGLLSVVINRAKAQVETCPNGYYLATNNLCYPYQLQQTQTPARKQLIITRSGFNKIR